MSTFSDVMVALSASLPSRVLSALGIGFISLQAFKPIIDSLINEVVLSWGQLPLAVLELFDIGGVTYGVNLLLSAYTAKASLLTIQYLGKLG